MKLRHAVRKVDGNHAAVVKALRGAGCGVVDLSAIGKGCPDLLVHGPVHPWSMWLMEVKDLSTARGKSGLNPEQQAFFDNWKGAKAVVTSPDEALATVMAQDAPRTTQECSGAIIP